MTSRIHIVGIGDDGFQGLTGHARQLIEQAEVLLGTSPLLRKIPATQAERIEIGAGLESLKDTIVKLPKRPTVMLAGGDPLLQDDGALPIPLAKTVSVVPHVSSMQLAFARVKESWDDAI